VPALQHLETFCFRQLLRADLPGRVRLHSWGGEIMGIRQRRVSFMILSVAIGALTLSGCQQIQTILPFVVQAPPKLDPTTVTDLGGTQRDADALFATLSAATGCAYSANTAQFNLVDQDLTTLVTQVKSLPNNSFTINGATLLQKGFDQFRAAAAAKDPACLPPGLAQDKKTSFDGAVANLLTYENAKPKGP
jgi:hypothetical protein